MTYHKKKGVHLFGKTPLISTGWETWIRTTIHGVRVRCPTIERSPITAALYSAIRFLCQSFFGLSVAGGTTLSAPCKM